MRKLIVLSFISLDGVMQAPGGPEEDPTGGFKYGGWTAPYFDDSLGKIMAEQMKGPFDMLLGRRTYEIFTAHWPYLHDPLADKFNKTRKYVASRTLKILEWENSHLIKGNVIEAVKKLKAEGGPDIQVHGSGNLIQTLLKADLVDQLKIKINPLTLGKGKRLFAEGTIPAGFRLVKSQTTAKGVIIADYIREGEVKTGSFALEKPTDAELARRKKLTGEESYNAKLPSKKRR